MKISFKPILSPILAGSTCLLWAIIPLLMGCNGGGGDPAPVAPPPPPVSQYPANHRIISGLITRNTLWSKDTVYVLRGAVVVETPNGAATGTVLTIQPGTVIKGERNPAGSLVLNGGILGRPTPQLIANGTATAPIVFTSSQSKGQRTNGDWGGVVLIGQNFANQWLSNTGTGRITVEGPLPDGLVYGGSNVTTDAGTAGAGNGVSLGSMSFVRIEFAGIPEVGVQNSEINGLTFYSVPAGTTIHHIQVSYSNDDSFEWFGGSVCCKYLVSFRGADDDFDSDFGWRGLVQFGLALRDPNRGDVDASNGFESDNYDPGDVVPGGVGLPYTRPVFSHITVIGPRRNEPGNYAVSQANLRNFNAGMRLRRNTRMNLFNSVVMGYTEGIEILGTLSAGALNLPGQTPSADAMELRNILLADVEIPYSDDGSTLFNDYGAALGIRFLSANSTSKGTGNGLYTDPYTLTAPKFSLAGGSPLASGADVTPANARIATAFTGVPANFFENRPFLGAIDPAVEDWLSGWTEWDPQNKDY
jgi:hypothetical protein